MTELPFDFAPYWTILQDAMQRDPTLAQLMNDPNGTFTAQDWQAPDAAGTDTPSGHGSDKGVYAVKGHLSVLMMENDETEQYDHLPTLRNYFVCLEDETHPQVRVRAVKLENGAFDLLIGEPPKAGTVSTPAIKALIGVPE